VVGIGWPYDWYSYPYPFWYDNSLYYEGDAYQPGPEDTQSATIGGGQSIVAEVQQDLANQGYNPGPVDGVMGPSTSNAIAMYQGDHGLSPTGQITGPLLDSLGL
jgi:peptidoglycan hydrolase-like protein with peptidoglycan-binding domain